MIEQIQYELGAAGPTLAILHARDITPTGVRLRNGRLHLCCLEGVFSLPHGEGEDTEGQGPLSGSPLFTATGRVDIATAIAIDENGEHLRSVTLSVAA